MTKEALNRALELITGSNSTQVSFNVPVNDNYSNVHQVLIHKCNAILINKLVSEGYSLHMTDKGLSIDKFKS